jgi:hypothetical protein
VVDGGGLENRCTRKGTRGSNPFPSARLRSPFGRASSRPGSWPGHSCSELIAGAKSVSPKREARRRTVLSTQTRDQENDNKEFRSSGVQQGFFDALLIF